MRSPTRFFRSLVALCCVLPSHLLAADVSAGGNHGAAAPGGKPVYFAIDGNPGNVRVSAFTPKGARNLVIARCEYFSEDDAKKKQPLEWGLLLLYSSAGKSIVGRIGVESPRFWLSRIAGDDNVYLVHLGACDECDGTSIVSVGMLGRGLGGGDLVFTDPESALRLSLGDGG